LTQLPPITCVAFRGIPVFACKRSTTGAKAFRSGGLTWLADQLVRQLRTRDNVAEARVSREKPEPPVGFPLPKKVVIKFAPGTAESESVAQKLVDESDVGFAQLMRELERDLDIPLKGEVSEKAEVLLQIDVRALTSILAERLKTLSDIESAQPNYILTIK
jgi:hypothetical protein